jgi:hypothetical protein
MANNSAEENARWVRDKVEERGLTIDVEAQALLIIEMQRQLEEL